MNNRVSANELKIKGVTILESITSQGSEAIISVRGENKYIVMTIEEYNHLRECELLAAKIEAENEIKAGNFVEESVEKHIERITNG